MFPIIGFLACQILGIVGSQIHKTEKKFSLISILTNTHKYCSQSNNIIF